MATTLLAFPVLPGQTDAARAFAQECVGPRFGEYDASERRIGITVENWYLLHGAGGDQFVVQIEGADLDGAIGAFMASTEPFDVWFKQQFAAITGYGFDGPPPANAQAETLGEYRQE